MKIPNNFHIPIILISILIALVSNFGAIISVIEPFTFTNIKITNQGYVSMTSFNQTFFTDNHGFSYNIVDIKSAATGCMVRSYLNEARKRPLTKQMCEGIYTAVMTDTGCFKYSNTDTYCHSIAIECLEKGVDSNFIYQKIYENSSKTRISVLGEMISNIKYDLDGQFAWSIVTNDTMKKYRASKNDLDGFPDFIRSIQGVEVAFVIYEVNKDICRINFRSKGKFTVNNIAKFFGGGGHAFASGAVVKRSLDKAKNHIINNCKKMLEEQIKVIK